MVNRENDQKLYLNVLGVRFFDGPIDWLSKGLSLGDSAECLQILKNMEAYEAYNDDAKNNLINDYSLFVFESSKGYRIRIVAAGVSVTKENLFSDYVL